MNAAVQSTPTAGRVQALIWLALFAALVAMLGGSARFDAVQITALRPLAALFLIPAFYYLTSGSMREAKVPLVLLAAITAWTAIQLIPLPPAIWHLLPGRGILAELDALQGIGDTWRPISWVPMRGWNALFALVVPIAAALLMVALRADSRTLLLIIVGIGVGDAALGLLQILGEPDGALYFYTLTNPGSPVGIFANENHSAMFSAAVLLIITKIGFSYRRIRRNSTLNIALGGAFVVVLLAVLVSGSRAGLGLGLAALCASALMVWLWLKRPQLDGEGASRFAALAQRPWLMLTIGLAGITAVLFALFQSDRAPGVINALNQDTFEDLRWNIVPILGDLMATHWLTGTGFGSFDAVYMAVEPTEFQDPAYLNQAHNDWAQLVIEGGLPTILIVLATVLWVSLVIRRIFARDPATLAMCVFWVMIFAVLAVASLVDYPLRTPVFQMIGVWLVIALAIDIKEEQSKSRKKLK